MVDSAVIMNARADDARDDTERQSALMKAILALVARHKEEFDALVEEELAARRTARSS